jgi:glycosyltransferase involved in cell wall biosynthesis
VETISRPGAASTSGHPAIGIDVTPLTSGHGIRGIGRYVAGLLEALGREEPEWCAEQLGVLVDGAAGPTWPSARTWRTRRAAIRPQDVGWLASAVFDRLAIRGSSPRLWHQTDPGSPFSPVPARRTIATVYDLIPLRDPAVMHRIRPHRRIPYRIYLRNVGKSRLVIAISETTAMDVREVLGVPAERVRVVYPAVVPSTGAGTPKAADGGSEPDFLFVGVPDPHKRPDLAIDALVAFRRINHSGRLTFVGFHPDRDRARLVARARTASVADAVVFRDLVSDRELTALYASSTLMALSRIEGFGLPPVEALLAGGRVIAAREPIYEEVLGDAACYAAEASPDAIAEAMLIATQSTPPIAALRRLEARFSWRATADALLAAYRTAQDLR